MSKFKYAFAIVILILALSLAVNSYLFFQEPHFESDESFQKQLENLEIQVTNLAKQVTELQKDKSIIENYLTTLESQALTLPNKIIGLQTENFELRNEIENLQQRIDEESQPIPNGTPKIVTRLGTTDVRTTPAPGHPWSGIIRFYISGEVWNVGTGPARNCRLHVTLYQGNIIANETYIELGTIAAGYYKDVSENIYYDGTALTNWTINPEFS